MPFDQAIIHSKPKIAEAVAALRDLGSEIEKAALALAIRIGTGAADGD